MCLSGHATIEELTKDIPLPTPGGEVPEGAIVGWRAWRVERKGGKPYLRSLAADASWPPRKPAKAHKKVRGEPDRVGIHAVADPKDIRAIGGSDTSKRDTVIGQVLLWGTVARHESGVKGFRAEFGYPLVLYTNDYSAQVKLRNEYGCSVMRQSAQNFVARKRAA